LPLLDIWHCCPSWEAGQVVLLKERIGRRLIAARVLAVCGAAILSIGDLSGGSTIYGPLAVVLAALSYALRSLRQTAGEQVWGPTRGYTGRTTRNSDDTSTPLSIFLQ